MGRQKDKRLPKKRTGHIKEPFVCERCGNPIRPKQYTCHFCRFRRGEEGMIR